MAPFRYRLCAFALFGLAACAMEKTPPGGPKVAADLMPTQGQTARGEVTLAQDGANVRVHVAVTGLSPGRTHGMHVHEKGDCSAPDASSAGGHLNPNQQPHGAPGAPHHAGDLPALKADSSGAASSDFSVVGTVQGGGAADLMGKTIVVHAGGDDYATQPDGGGGQRIACGVIRPPQGRDPSGKPTTVPKEL